MSCSCDEVHSWHRSAVGVLVCDYCDEEIDGDDDDGEEVELGEGDHICPGCGMVFHEWDN